MQLPKISSTLSFFKGHSTLDMQGENLHCQPPPSPWMSGSSHPKICPNFSTSSSRRRSRSRSSLSFHHNPFGYNRSRAFPLEQLKVAGKLRRRLALEPRRDVNPKLLISVTLLVIQHTLGFKVSFTFRTVWFCNSVEVIYSINEFMLFTKFVGVSFFKPCDWMSFPSNQFKFFEIWVWT